MAVAPPSVTYRAPTATSPDDSIGSVISARPPVRALMARTVVLLVWITSHSPSAVQFIDSARKNDDPVVSVDVAPVSVLSNGNRASLARGNAIESTDSGKAPRRSR